MSVSGMKPEVGAQYALTVMGLRLDPEESRWFSAEMVRSAQAVNRAADAAGPLFDIRMASFDVALRAGGEPG